MNTAAVSLYENEPFLAMLFDPVHDIFPVFCVTKSSLIGGSKTIVFLATALDVDAAKAGPISW